MSDQGGIRVPFVQLPMFKKQNFRTLFPPKKQDEETWYDQAVIFLINWLSSVLILRIGIIKTQRRQNRRYRQQAITQKHWCLWLHHVFLFFLFVAARLLMILFVYLLFGNRDNINLPTLSVKDYRSLYVLVILDCMQTNLQFFEL